MVPHAGAFEERLSDEELHRQKARPRKALADELRDLERLRIVDALEAAGGVQSKACESLGMPPRTLFAKLRAYGIDPQAFGVARSRPKR